MSQRKSAFSQVVLAYFGYLVEKVDIDNVWQAQLRRPQFAFGDKPTRQLGRPITARCCFVEFQGASTSDRAANLGAACPGYTTTLVQTGAWSVAQSREGNIARGQNEF
jgi:hypothetical protein